MSARPRRGGALVAVLVALAVVGVLVASALHGATSAARGERTARAERRAEDAVDGALVASAARLALAALPVAETTVTAGGADTLLLAARELGGGVRWLVAHAVVRDAPGAPPLARRRRGLLLVPASPPAPPEGAVLVRGTLSLEAGALVEGRDASEPDPRCDPPAADDVGVVQLDALLGDSLARWADELVRDAPPERIAPLADSAPPALPLAPLVHVARSLLAPPGTWHGVLVVDGDLRLAAGAELAGVVVVRGRLRADGAGSRVRGALLLLGDASHVADGDVVLSRARCAVRSALQRLAVPRPPPARAWASVW